MTSRLSPSSLPSFRMSPTLNVFPLACLDEEKKKVNFQPFKKSVIQGRIAQNLPLMVTLPSMVTTMETLILIGY